MLRLIVWNIIKSIDNYLFIISEIEWSLIIAINDEGTSLLKQLMLIITIVWHADEKEDKFYKISRILLQYSGNLKNKPSLFVLEQLDTNQCLLGRCISEM